MYFRIKFWLIIDISTKKGAILLERYLGTNLPMNPQTANSQEANRLKRVLPLSFIVIYGLAYLIPTSVFDMYGIVSNMTHGMLALTHAVTALAMIFTAYSYGRMAAVYPYSGSAYTYAQKAIADMVFVKATCSAETVARKARRVAVMRQGNGVHGAFEY
jgi:amino acid permease